jgi:hypothetical protein
MAGVVELGTRQPARRQYSHDVRHYQIAARPVVDQTIGQTYRNAVDAVRLWAEDADADCPAADGPAEKRSADEVAIYQMRWKTSVPRTLRPANVAVPVATIVVGLAKRPIQLVVTLQSGVQFLYVWKIIRLPRMLPTTL